MEISWLGHSSFKIKGKQAVVITDPFFDAHLGIKFPKIEADIVTVSHSHSDHNAANLVKGSPFVISGPGEYEVKGVSFFGIHSFHDAKQGSQRGENTIYLIEMDSLRICHLGDLGEALNDQILEEINGVDILMVPVGGFYTIDSKQAAELVNQIEPSVVIPMHFKIPQMGSEFAQMVGVENFLKEMEAENIQPLPKLVISKDELPQERQTVLLERKS